MATPCGNAPHPLDSKSSVLLLYDGVMSLLLQIFIKSDTLRIIQVVKFMMTIQTKADAFADFVFNDCEAAFANLANSELFLYWIGMMKRYAPNATLSAFRARLFMRIYKFLLFIVSAHLII